MQIVQKSKALFVLALWLTSGCTTMQKTNLPVEPASSDYELVFVLHGDAGYLYHDESGRAVRADEHMLKSVIELATTLTNAEVFIFHQQKLKRRFFFFSKEDGTFYHYKNGQKLREEDYKRHPEKPGLEDERILYTARKIKVPDKVNPDPVSLFLYFGHEIPERAVQGYHTSYPEATFGISHLAEALSKWGPNNEPRNGSVFDSVVLSTCNNGSPAVVAALAPYTRYIMASPTNLHLSYFDIGILHELADKPSIENLEAFLQQWATTSFDKLVARVQTVVSVSVYDTQVTKTYIDQVMPAYTSRLRNSNEQADLLSPIRTDCLKDALLTDGLSIDEATPGVFTRYRPARFGRKKNQLSHSGWSCSMLDE